MSSPAEPIRGKVARVLSMREVALNKGSSDGVRVGMVFRILNSKGSEITDPDTGEVIGFVELEKASVKVISVQDRVSFASTFRTHRVNVGGSGIELNRLFAPPKWETRVETLEAEQSAAEESSEEESLVRTGDPVVQVAENIDLGNSTRDVP